MLELNKFFLIQLLYEDVFSLSYFESTAMIVMIVTFHYTDDIHSKGFSLKKHDIPILINLMRLC